MVLEGVGVIVAVRLGEAVSWVRASLGINDEAAASVLVEELELASSAS